MLLSCSRNKRQSRLRGAYCALRSSPIIPSTSDLGRLTGPPGTRRTIAARTEHGLGDLAIVHPLSTPFSSATRWRSLRSRANLELLNVNVKKRRSAPTGMEAGREGPVGRRRRTEPGARLHYRSEEK